MTQRNYEGSEIKEKLQNEDFWKKATDEEIISEIMKVEEIVDQDPLYKYLHLQDISLPIIYTVQFNKNPSIIKILIKLGANINVEDLGRKTALMYAAEKSITTEIIQTLVELGADINAKDFIGNTPLMYAAEKNTNPEIIKVLVKFGADVNVKGHRGDTPLMYAAEKNESPEVIKTLVELGANVNAKGYMDTTPLMYAAENNKNSEVIKTLVELGADINATSIDGRTPLMHAAEKNENPEVIKTLIELGADINVYAFGDVFDYAKKNSNQEIINMMAEFHKQKIKDDIRKIDKIIKKYENILYRKYKQTHYMDDYGKEREVGWNKEIDYFIEHVIKEETEISVLSEYKIKSIINSHMTDMKHNLLNDKIALEEREIKIKTGIDYENYIEAILAESNFVVSRTPTTGDQGVDLIATKNGKRIAIQCKYYSKPVGNKAVQEVIAGRDYYECEHACVVSNNTFTLAAKKLASVSNILLLNENNIVEKFNNLLSINNKYIYEYENDATCTYDRDDEYTSDAIDSYNEYYEDEDTDYNAEFEDNEYEEDVVDSDDECKEENDEDDNNKSEDEELFFTDLTSFDDPLKIK